MSTFVTIGHSTRPVEAFAGLLKAAEVRLVVDVRTVPRSRTNPQFNRDVIPAALAPHGVAYEHLPELGGLRGPQRGVSPDVNAFWENASFHNYADYAMGDEFRSGLRNLYQDSMIGTDHRLIAEARMRARAVARNRAR